jgi:PAS domain S-box-containing protein
MSTFEHYTAMGAYSPGSIVAVFDSAGNLLSASRQGRDKVTIAHSQGPQHPWLAIDPGIRDRMNSVLRETIRSGSGQRTEYRIAQGDGNVHLVEILSNILDAAEGKGSNIVVISRDIAGGADRVWGFLSIMEATGSWFWEIDANGIYSYAGPKVRDLLGYEPDEVVGRKPAQFAVAEDAAALSKKLASLVAERKPVVNFETRKVHKNGTVVIVESNAVPLVDDENRLYRYQGIDRDITSRKQVEDQLRKLSRAVEQSPAGIIITDKKGNIEYVNPRFCEMSGYKRDEVIGRNPRILKSGEMPPEGYKRMWETIASGREWRGEFHNRKKNGELYWEFASLSPIKDGEGKITHFLALKEDVTDRKRTDEERLKLVVELQEALAKVNTLTGLLPICAWCKKVRDDEGYWKQIENYVEAHSNAEFTHGICPDCAQKMQATKPKARRKVVT